MNVAITSGATRGIGAETARRLAAEGACLILSGHLLRVGGVYNLMRPDTADEVGRRKFSNGSRPAPASNPGCALKIEAQSRQAGGHARDASDRAHPPVAHR